MPTLTIRMDDLRTYTNYQGLGQTLEELNSNMGTYWVPTGGASSFQTATEAASDGNTLQGITPPSMDIYFEDAGTIDALATINSVQIVARVKTASDPIDVNTIGGLFYISTPGATFPDDFTAVFYIDGNIGPSFATIQTAVLTTNPKTGLPWTRAQLFAIGAHDSVMDRGGQWELYFSGNDPTFDYVALVVDYTPSAPAARWCYNPSSNHFVYAAECPGEPFHASDPPTPTITGIRPRST